MKRHVSTNLGVYAGHKITLDDMDSSDDGQEPDHPNLSYYHSMGTMRANQPIAGGKHDLHLLGSNLPGRSQEHLGSADMSKALGSADAKADGKSQSAERTTSAVQVKSKNGYLFLKRMPSQLPRKCIHGVAVAPPTKGGRRDQEPAKASLKTEPEEKGCSPETAKRKTIRLKSHARFFNRHKYFQGLP